MASLASPARADRTPRLAGLIRPNSDGVVVPESVLAAEVAFEDLATELATVLGPRRLGPAATTGPLGFDLGIDIVLASIDDGAVHWQNSVDDPGSVLPVLSVQAKKGLPFGFELGAGVAHLLDSELWSVGAALRWAFLENLGGYFPDMAIRVTLDNVIGASDFGMLLVGSDLVISREFGLGGVTALAPYVGFSGLFVRASPNVIGFFDEGASRPQFAAFAVKNLGAFRGVLGFRLLFPYSTFSFEAVVSSGVQTYNTSLSVAF